MGKRKNAGKIWALAILPPLFLLTGCETYPGVDGENASQLMAYTHWQENIDFTEYATFCVNDSMGVLTADGKTKKVKNRRSDLIRNQIIACMQQAGYTSAAIADSAHLSLTMVEVEQVNVSISYDPYIYFWNTYDPWGWGYYYGYPYYPSYYVSSAYSTQTVSIQMGDRKNKTRNEDKEVLPVIWNAYIKGLSGYDRSDEEIRNTVSECFTQTGCPPFRLQ